MEVLLALSFFSLLPGFLDGIFHFVDELDAILDWMIHMLAVKIAGLGWSLPARRVTNTELEARTGVSAQWIERATGVCERRYVTGETTVSMGTEASRMALAHAGMTVDAVDAIIMASTAPQQAIPCTAVFLQRALGAPDGRSSCFDINATCLSFLFALQMAAHLVAAGAYRTILICSSEIASSGLNYNEPESSVLFGDAAAAAVITRSIAGEESNVAYMQFATFSSGADLTRLSGGGTLQHPNDPTTTPEMNLFHMEGPAVFKQASLLLGPFLDSFFAHLDWRREEIDAIIPHQASKHGIRLLTSRLGFADRQVVWNLEQRGNCIAASIPLTFAEAVHNQRVQRGDRLLLIGTGAGLTIGAVARTF